ncbi:DUF5701 family protein [soil metagenome]
MGIKTSAPEITTPFSTEFDRQLRTLQQKGCAGLAGLTNEQFAAQLEPLKEQLSELNPATFDAKDGKLPFVIVITRDLVSPEQTVRLFTWGDHHCTVDLSPRSISHFAPTPDTPIPAGGAYLLVDIDRGRETLNIPPAEAIKTLQQEQRSPLTIEEGIAILTHHPEFLVMNNCFSLLGSRCGDRRVPALWISERRPRLGWCWEGAPHTRLGSASCLARLGPS